jgi:hypothetical protein
MPGKDKTDTNSLQKKRATKCKSMDEGTFAFLKWTNCMSFESEGYEKNPPLVLKYIDFPNLGWIKLFDRFWDMTCISSLLIVLRRAVHACRMIAHMSVSLFVYSN